MNKLISLTKRNIKVYFSDRKMFFTSLVTPIILLVLYVTFLSGVFKDSFISAFPEGFKYTDKLLNSLVGGQLISSLLAVSCITVAFTSNLLMVQDKAEKNIKDINITPISKFTIGLSYFFSTFISTFIVNFTVTIICFIYAHLYGTYMNITDMLNIVLDLFLLTLFGTSLSSVINFNLSTQGQVSAVGTIISAGYGFICGAYMPISSFGKGLQKVLAFLPGTYGTSLLRNHALSASFREMRNQHLPEELIDGFKKAFDCKIKLLGNYVSINSMYLIVTGFTLAFIVIFIFMNKHKKRS